MTYDRLHYIILRIPLMPWAAVYDAVSTRCFVNHITPKLSVLIARLIF